MQDSEFTSKRKLEQSKARKAKAETSALKSCNDSSSEDVSLSSKSLSRSTTGLLHNRKNDLILIMTPEKQDKSLELSKHWSVDSTPARNEVIMKRTYPVKSVKCDKICSNY